MCLVVWQHVVVVDMVQDASRCVSATMVPLATLTLDTAPVHPAGLDQPALTRMVRRDLDFPVHICNHTEKSFYNVTINTFS